MTTFDCFNRTNIDEGFKTGLYKGWQIAIAGSIMRSMLTLPVIDAVRSISPKKAAQGEQSSMIESFMERIGVSLFSSSIMSLLFYPLDTAKRCLQLNGMKGYIKPYN